MGGARHRGGPAARAEALIVYGRNPVREALRGRRKVQRLWASDAVAGERWLEGQEVRSASGAELTELCGSEEHQGVCAEVERYPYADARALLAPDDALVVALDQVQ